MKLSFGVISEQYTQYGYTMLLILLGGGLLAEDFVPGENLHEIVQSILQEAYNLKQKSCDVRSMSNNMCALFNHVNKTIDSMTYLIEHFGNDVISDTAGEIDKQVQVLESILDTIIINKIDILQESTAHVFDDMIHSPILLGDLLTGIRSIVFYLETIIEKLRYFDKKTGSIQDLQREILTVEKIVQKIMPYLVYVTDTMNSMLDYIDVQLNGLGYDLEKMVGDSFECASKIDVISDYVSNINPILHNFLDSIDQANSNIFSIKDMTLRTINSLLQLSQTKKQLSLMTDYIRPMLGIMEHMMFGIGTIAAAIHNKLIDLPELAVDIGIEATVLEKKLKDIDLENALFFMRSSFEELKILYKQVSSVFTRLSHGFDVGDKSVSQLKHRLCLYSASIKNRHSVMTDILKNFALRMSHVHSSYDRAYDLEFLNALIVQQVESLIDVPFVIEQEIFNSQLEQISDEISVISEKNSNHIFLIDEIGSVMDMCDDDIHDILHEVSVVTCNIAYGIDVLSVLNDMASLLDSDLITVDDNLDTIDSGVQYFISITSELDHSLTHVVESVKDFLEQAEPVQLITDIITEGVENVREVVCDTTNMSQNVRSEMHNAHKRLHTINRLAYQVGYDVSTVDAALSELEGIVYDLILENAIIASTIDIVHVQDESAKVMLDMVYDQVNRYESYIDYVLDTMISFTHPIDHIGQVIFETHSFIDTIRALLPSMDTVAFIHDIVQEREVCLAYENGQAFFAECMLMDMNSSVDELAIQSDIINERIGQIVEAYTDVPKNIQLLHNEGIQFKSLLKSLLKCAEKKFCTAQIAHEMTTEGINTFASLLDSLDTSVNMINTLQSYYHVYEQEVDSIAQIFENTQRFFENTTENVEGIYNAGIESSFFLQNALSTFDVVHETLDTKVSTFDMFYDVIEDMRESIFMVEEQSSTIVRSISLVDQHTNFFQSHIESLQDHVCSLISIFDIYIPQLSSIDSRFDRLESFVMQHFDKASSIDIVFGELDEQLQDIQVVSDYTAGIFEGIESMFCDMEITVSIFEQNIASRVDNTDEIVSSVDVFESRVCTIASRLEAIEQQGSLLDSALDNIQSNTGIIESKVCHIQSIVENIEQISSITDQNFLSICDITQNIMTQIADFVDIRCYQVIRQSDIPFTITQAGVYCLGEPVDFFMASPVITVENTDCVVLDLNGYSINADPSNDGINIANVTHMIIRNGTIKNGMRGIHINSSSCIGLSDLILNGATNGIEMNMSMNVECISCMSSVNTVGFQIISGNRIILRDCSARSVEVGVAFDVDTLQSCCIETKVADYSMEAFLNAGTANVFLSCIAQGNGTHGFLITGDKGVIRDCIVLESMTGFDLSGNQGLVRTSDAIGVDNGVVVSAVANGILSDYIAGDSALSSVGITNSGTGTRIFNNMVSNTLAQYTGVSLGTIELVVTTSTHYWANI